MAPHHPPPPRLSSDDLAALLDVTRALAEPFDLSTMLAEVVAAARRVLRAERASVWLVDEAAQELFVEVSSDLGRARVPIGVGLVGECAATRRAVNVPDCYADARFNAAVDRASGFHTRCSLSLPLVDRRGKLVGVLQVLNRDSGAFDAGDESLGEALAARCAVALSRARLAEAALAAEEQRATLPESMPALPGHDLYGHFRPAEQTGGDTFDLALLPQGLLVVLANATGHGIAPALSATPQHAMLRLGFGLGATLERVFTEVNDHLALTLPDGRFVTAFVGLLDPRTHGLRFLSGGQGPILHYQAARGACTAYRATRFPMSAMPLTGPSPLRPAVTLTLAPCDWLVLLSDGVYERADAAGAPFGRERVERLLCAGAGGSAAKLAADLLQAADRHAVGEPADDDVTLVLIKRLDGTPGAHTVCDAAVTVMDLSHDGR